MLDGRFEGSVVARMIGDDYNRHVATLNPDDFWGQVRRHVFGRPVTQDQIDLIIQAVVQTLQLKPEDALLDLACGNGALSSRIARCCGSVFGVDVSEALIAVANTNFAMSPRISFKSDDVALYVDQEPSPESFTKALCYGSFSYLTHASAAHVLRTLAVRFSNIERVFIGNLPDPERFHAFYPGRSVNEPELNNPLSDIGIWRTRAEFSALAKDCGWHARLSAMPAQFYAAHYRYDATLTRL